MVFSYAVAGFNILTAVVTVLLILRWRSHNLSRKHFAYLILIVVFNVILAAANIYAGVNNL